MPMLTPSVPTDKNKQGGRNYDASKMTDFKKVAVIDGVKDSKFPNQNNRNIYTNVDEQRRAAVLYSSLRGIPRFLCKTCPTPAYNFFTTQCTSGVAVSGQTTFWIMYDIGSGGFAYTYSNYSITDAPLNSDFSSNVRYAKVLINLSSVQYGLTNPTTRQGILDSINKALNDNTGSGKTITLPITASYTSDGRITLSTPSNIPAGRLLGLYFGTANQTGGNTGNGSTDLGVTNQINTPPGVNYAALLITGGTNSVTAPFSIAC